MKAPLNLFIPLCLLLLASCSVLGIESTSAANERQAEMTKFVNDKVDAQQKRNDKVFLKTAEAIDSATGGVTQTKAFMAETLASTQPDSVRAPEPREEPVDWEGIAMAAVAILTGGAGLYAKTKSDAVNTVNAQRDAKRAEIGLPRSREEAFRLGWIDERGNPIPEKVAT